MKRILSFLLYIFCLCCSIESYAQRKNITFEHIGTEQGLSQSNIFSIIQDSRGFMWFGTWDGLNKYDGYKFTVYKNKPGDSTSISNNYINQIAESKNGELWVATNNGLNCFDRKKEQFKRFKNNPGNINSINSNIVYNVIEDAAGKIWIGTNMGLDKYDPLTNKFEHFLGAGTGYGKAPIQVLFQDSHQRLWIGVLEKGLTVYDLKTKSFSKFEQSDGNSSSLSSNNINTIFEDSRHNLWFGTNGGGLDLYEAATASFKHFKHEENNPNSLAGNVVLAINEDADHNLWVSSENVGLSIFNYRQNRWTTYRHDEVDQQSISNNSIYSIYRDTKNDMWLGNFAAWIDVAMSDKLLFAHYRHTMNENSLANNQVLSITEDSKGKIWIGTDGGGLDEFDPQTNTFKHYRHQKNNPQTICGDYVLNTLEDRNGNVWVGSYNEGITVLNANRQVIKHFKHDAANINSIGSSNAWKLFQDKDGNIWIGTFGAGLDLLNPDRKTFTHYMHNDADAGSISGNNVIEIFQDADGDLWVGTESDGLNLFNKETKTFTHYQHDDNKNSISNNNINSVYEDYEHNIWIGTMNGLNMLNKKTGVFTCYNSSAGLAGDYVFGILEDDKHSLWISTNKGISKFNTITKAFENFGVSDGLQSAEYKQLAFCKTTSGMMYFGGINGFNQFRPADIKKISFEPPMVLTGFNVFNKQVPIETADVETPLKESITEVKNIILPYSNSVFSLEFASLNYTNREKKQYAYMLEGFDKSWIEAGTATSATYTNLDPGNYVFKVRGFDNDGRLSSRVTEVEIIIKPPFWLTWWFKLAMLTTIAGAAAGFYRRRINAVKKQQQQLQQQVEAQTYQLLLSAHEEKIARQEAEKAHQAEKLANKELEASEQRYSNLFHESPQPMWVYDIETLKFVQVNKAAIAHYGYTEKEFLQMTIVDIRPEDENCFSILSGKIANRKDKIVFNGRFKHRIKSGELIEVEIYSNPIVLNDKEYRLIIAVDITEKILVENKITKAIIKTQEDERYEIGGELHDNVCQILASSQLSIGMLKDYLPSSVLPHYHQGKKFITMALEEIRNLSHRLAPVFFEDMPLQEAFQQLADSFNANNQYNITLYFYKSVNQDLINREIQLNLYRILQEQLRNIVKHSHATDIGIDVSINENMELVMETSDDGVGFNPGTTKTGIGLANMKRRVEVFSGTIHIDSSPGNGCNIIITIPLAETPVIKTGAGYKI